jgi:hypothetical protein
VVARYAAAPAIADWALMNEAESRTLAGAPDPDALYAFARDMGAYVKQLDPNHLVTLGTIGGGQPGVDGPNLERLHRLPDIDFVEFHDYHAEDEPLPGAPLIWKAPLIATLYTQDHDWVWRDPGYKQGPARRWETWEGMALAGGTPFQRIGLNLLPDFEGDVYVDAIEIGGRRYDFEDGTTQGWQVSGPASLSNVCGPALSGRRALKLRLTGKGAVQLWIPATAADTAGTPIRFHLYADSEGYLANPNTLAAAMAVARRLDKPILVGEAGMTICPSQPGWRPETAESRARKLDAKLEAFFRNGGAGYLIWAWEPAPACGHAFTSGDPLNAVLARHAAELTGGRGGPAQVLAPRLERVAFACG